MAYEYEHVIGFIQDMLLGDGSKDMARYIDCPVCRKPLDLTVVDDDEITVVCPVDRTHMDWHGYYEDLPAWIGEYKKLNT